MGLPGVGLQVAAVVLALLPPCLWGRAKAAAAYAGLIPEREESAIPEGASPSAKEAFLPSPPLAEEARRAGPGGRGPQANRRRMMGRLREHYAGQSLQGVA